MDGENEEEPGFASIDDMKHLAVGVITSALIARESNGFNEERVTQFTKDFNMLIGEFTPYDIYRLCSLLADTSAGLVQVVAKRNDVESSIIMQMLAAQIIDSDIAGDD